MWPSVAGTSGDFCKEFSGILRWKPQKKNKQGFDEQRINFCKFPLGCGMILLNIIKCVFLFLLNILYLICLARLDMCLRGPPCSVFVAITFLGPPDAVVTKTMQYLL